ncbi:MAG: ABC transporter ATP-binding protein [Lautropia sp.]
MRESASASAVAALALRGVAKRFPTARGEFTALEGIDLDVAPGEFVSILGPSGCGKSTLLYMIGGFVPPSAGSIHSGGAPVTRPGRDRGIVFQDASLFPWLTVAGNVAYGLREGGLSSAAIEEKVAAMLALVHLEDFTDFRPGQLSGGMRQRVAIARTLAYDPAILLMDEPFGALDAYTRTVLQDELLALWDRSRKTVVFVTHGVDEAVYLSDRVVLMSRSPGRVHSEIRIELPRPRVRSALLRCPVYQEYVITLGEAMMRMHGDA